MKKKYSNRNLNIKNIFIIGSIILLISIILIGLYIYYNKYNNHKKTNENFTNKIPIIIICWNNYY